MIAIDTNVLLRFLFKPLDKNNPQWQVEKAEEIINSADKVFISLIVIAEAEWVLESRKIYSVIHELANHTKFEFEDWAALNNALLDYAEYNNVELSDCIIASEQKMPEPQHFIL